MRLSRIIHITWLGPDERRGRPKMGRPLLPNPGRVIRTGMAA